MLNKEKKIIVTGGAGFIGSNVIAALNDAGYDRIILVDHLTNTGKWQHLVPLKYESYYDREEFLAVLPILDDIDTIIHLGACSATTETDENFLLHNNTIFSKKLFDFSIKNNCKFIYASSAATYGNGDTGYKDQEDNLSPLNCYGYSKYLFDTWVKKSVAKPTQWVGLKFFNVYGPGEEFKKSMASMAYHGFYQAISDGEIRLFTSHKKGYADGEQQRDFIYINDVIKILFFFLEHPDVSGIFNVGTGKKRTFKDLATAVFTSLQKEPNIRYIPMPETLREKYQYETEADITSLRKAGYTESFHELEDGIQDYISYLLKKLAAQQSV